MCKSVPFADLTRIPPLHPFVRIVYEGPDGLDIITPPVTLVAFSQDHFATIRVTGGPDVMIRVDGTIQKVVADPHKHSDGAHDAVILAKEVFACSIP
jgi:hypothetical protein